MNSRATLLSILPEATRRVLEWRIRRTLRPAWLGTLRRTGPLSDNWGFDRGNPIDRYYIEHFIARHRRDIRGDVLEVKDTMYTDMFGTAVSSKQVLDVGSGNPKATMVADIGRADGLPQELCDCFVLTQTLQLVHDVRAAIENAHRVLRPRGVLLATVPSLSRVVLGQSGYDDHWRFTRASCITLFGGTFGPSNIEVEAYGNVLTCIAFLTGMARQELSIHELNVRDPAFPVIIAIRAVKAAA